MKRLIVLLLIFVHTGLFLYAQNWQPVGRGVNTGEVKGLFADTITNRLYVVGNFSKAFGYSDTVIVNGTTYWDGSDWFPLGTGETGCGWSWCPNPSVSIIRYGSDMYTGGAFSAMGAIPNTRGFARWDGSNWNSVYGLSGMSADGGVLRFKTINNKLYAMGIFDSIAGIEAHSIVSWDGAHFSNVNNFPNFYSGGGNILAIDSLNGELYVGGNFESPVVPAMKEVIRWDGTQWQPLQNGILGGSDWVDDMVVYKNELYVCGEIRKSDGNVANGVMVWNGSNWSEFSPNVDFNSQIWDLNVIDNVLYISGAFTFVGDPAQKEYGLSKYDGTTFSAFGGVNSWVYSTAGLNGNLYVAANDTIGTDTVHFVAQWMGGASVDTSISVLSVGVNNIIGGSYINVYPNPTNGDITLEFENQITDDVLIEVKNVLGQTVYLKEIKNLIGKQVKNIDVSAFSKGIYFVQLKSNNTISSKKFIKE